MANETVVSAAESATNEVTGLLDKAIQAFGDSVKVAMKAQEDTVKLWGETIGKVTPVPGVPAEWVPVAQKSADDYLKLIETSYRRNADLLKKALHSQNGGSGQGLEKSTREWWEASMEVARDNTQDLVNTNMRVAQSWTEALKKGAPQKVAVGK